MERAIITLGTSSNSRKRQIYCFHYPIEFPSIADGEWWPRSLTVHAPWRNTTRVGGRLFQILLSLHQCTYGSETPLSQVIWCNIQGHILNYPLKLYLLLIHIFSCDANNQYFVFTNYVFLFTGVHDRSGTQLWKGLFQRKSSFTETRGPAISFPFSLNGKNFILLSYISIIS